MSFTDILGHYAPTGYFDKEHRRVIGSVRTNHGQDFTLVQTPLPTITENKDTWQFTIRERLMLSLDRGFRDSEKAPFIALGERGDNMRLQGMFVPADERGEGLAHVLFGVAIEIAKILRNNEITHTGPIHKPDLPGFLKKYGFTPITDRYNILQVTGHYTDEHGHAVPLVRVIQRKMPLIYESGGHRFLKEASSDELAEVPDLSQIPHIPISVPFSVTDRERFDKRIRRHKSDFELKLHGDALLLGTSLEFEREKGRLAKKSRKKTPAEIIRETMDILGKRRPK